MSFVFLTDVGAEEPALRSLALKRLESGAYSEQEAKAVSVCLGFFPD